MTWSWVRCKQCKKYNFSVSTMKRGVELAKEHVKDNPEHTVTVSSDPFFRGWYVYSHAEIHTTYTVTKDGVKKVTKTWGR